MLIADINSCRNLAATVHSLGAQMPEALMRPLEAFDIIQRRRVSKSQSRDLAGLLSSSEPLTDAAIDRLIDDMAQDYARGQISREISEGAERITLQTFRASLMAEGGDELTEQLRPTFNKACADLVHVMAHVSPGMTAAQAIEAGPETVTAWQLASDVDARFSGFTRYAIVVGRDMATVGLGTAFSHPMAPLMAFFVSGDDDLDHAARAFSTSELSQYRAGSFHALVAKGGIGLDLCSPRAAQAKCEAYGKGVADALEAQRAALNTQAVKA